nr:MAG TPA_asm: hypothetical protein [Caudoviricetes sp.]
MALCLSTLSGRTPAHYERRLAEARCGARGLNKNTVLMDGVFFSTHKRAAGLFLLCALERGDDFGFRGFGVVPAIHFHPFAFFQIFVVLKEVGDLRTQQLWQVVHIFDVIVLFREFGVRHGNQFGIFARLVGHFQYANRTAADHGARYQWVRGRNQYVNRVTIQREGVVDIAVVARIEHRGRHETVYKQGTRLFINFIFDRISIRWDLNDNVDIFWQVFTCWHLVQTHRVFLQ